MKTERADTFASLIHRGWQVRLSIVSICAIFAGGAQSQTSVDSLLKSAKAEGEVFFYGSPVPDVLRRTAAGFTAKFGIPANFLRLPGSTRVFQRFSAAAETGTCPADVPQPD